MNNWPVPPVPLVMENDRVRLESLDTDRDLSALWNAASIETNGEDLFRYHVGSGPFATRGEFETYLRDKQAGAAERTYTVFSKRLKRLVGGVSLLNLRPAHGAVEVGSVWYQKAAQKSEINTNTMLLLFSYVLDELGYRRLEWKCNNENQDSKRAALRLGFQYEGLFRQHFWDKGKNRDTAWFSIIDGEWPGVKERLNALASRPAV